MFGIHRVSNTRTLSSNLPRHLTPVHLSFTRVSTSSRRSSQQQGQVGTSGVPRRNVYSFAAIKRIYETKRQQPTQLNQTDDEDDMDPWTSALQSASDSRTTTTRPLSPSSSSSATNDLQPPGKRARFSGAYEHEDANSTTTTTTTKPKGRGGGRGRGKDTTTTNPNSKRPTKKQQKLLLAKSKRVHPLGPSYEDPLDSGYEQGTAEDVLWRDVIDALGGEEYVLGQVKEGRDTHKSVPKELSGGRGVKVEVECEVVGLTSDGE
jgi:hypothetical protein